MREEKNQVIIKIFPVIANIMPIDIGGRVMYNYKNASKEIL